MSELSKLVFVAVMFLVTMIAGIVSLSRPSGTTPEEKARSRRYAMIALGVALAVVVPMCVIQIIATFYE